MKRFMMTKEKIVTFLLSIGFALMMTSNVFHIKDILGSTAPYILAGVIGSVITFLVFQAGLVIIRALAFVAAELSLIIFLAQSYCAEGVTRSAQGDYALSALMVLGFSYITYRFLTDVYKELKVLIEKFKAIDGKWSVEVIVMSVCLILFTVLFLRAVYLVISPITTSLCIY